MLQQELKEMLSVSGTTCISAVLPVFPAAKERKLNSEMLKDLPAALGKMPAAISDTTGKVKALIDKVRGLVDRADLDQGKNGIGIYVSDQLSKLCYFRFPVVPKIKMKGTFEMRDLLFDDSGRFPCYVLAISKKELRLFQSDGEGLSEIRNKDFPLHYTEEYEYSRPGRATSYSGNIVKEFEPDKSVMGELRLKQMLRAGDELLAKYLEKGLPLIITGESKELADYLQVTRFKNRVIGKIPGNYSHNGKQQLEGLVGKEIGNYTGKRLTESLTGLQELIGKNLVVYGIGPVWEAVMKGNCRRLYVEKDYESPAYINSSSGEMKRSKPLNADDYSFEGDVVEQLIRMVLEKNGEVLFTGNERLSDLSGIALELRYPAPF